MRIQKAKPYTCTHGNNGCFVESLRSHGLGGLCGQWVKNETEKFNDLKKYVWEQLEALAYQTHNNEWVWEGYELRRIKA